MESRIKNSIRNIIAAFINRIILIVLPFILRSVMVKSLGSSFLGLNTLFISILSILSLSELGFGAALVYSMYEPASIGDKVKLSALLNFYKKIYTFVGIAILFVGGILIPFIPNFINKEIPDGINIYVLYVLFLLNTAFSYLFLAYKRALLIAYQRNDVISSINTITSIIMYGIQIMTLSFSRNYYAYIIILIVFGILENIIISYRASTFCPGITCSGIIGRNEYKNILKNVKGIALQKICSASRNSFDSIIISSKLGLLDVAQYGNYYTVMNAVHVMLYQIPNSIRASVGNSIVSEDKQKNYDDFRKFNFIYMWICGVCTCCILCVFQPFMDMWMGSENLLSLSSVILFCVYFYELSLTDILYVYRDAAGLWWFGRYATLIEAGLNLVLNFVLGYYWGINGVLIATVVTVLFITLAYYCFIIFKYYFTLKNIGCYIKDTVLYFLLTVVAAMLSYIGCMILEISGVVAIFVKGAICFAIVNFTYWLILRKHWGFRCVKELLLPFMKV